VTVSGGTNAGTKTIPISISDAQSRTGTTSVQLTVAAETPTSTDGQVVFPHFADGGGYRTSLLLTNGTATNTTATVSFFSSSGSPVTVTIGSTTASTFPVPIQANGAVKLTTAGTGTSPSVGWVLVTPVPAVGLNGNAIFQLFREGQLFSEASVPAAALATISSSSPTRRADSTRALRWPIPGPRTRPAHLPSAMSPAPSRGPTRSLSGRSARRDVPLPGAYGVPSGRAEISLTTGALSATALRYHTSSIFSTVSVGTPGPVRRPFRHSSHLTEVLAPRIVRRDHKATSSIDIAIYSFTADEIRDALTAARNRSVTIRIIADTSQAAGQGSEISTWRLRAFP